MIKRLSPESINAWCVDVCDVVGVGDPGGHVIHRIIQLNVVVG